MLREHRAQCVEDYEIIQTLSKGDFGNVYSARRRIDGRQVAIKLMRSQTPVTEPSWKRFQREIALLKQLRHPRIVELIDDGIAGDLLFFTMEYFEEGSVADLIKREGGRLPWKDAVAIVVDVLPALEYAHKCIVTVAELDGQVNVGVVHRDIKPHNILIREKDSRRTASLADFGLAKAFGAAGHSGITVTGTLAGTLPFMPPEQALDFIHVRPVSDIWSLGATLYQMITGMFPRDASPGLSDWEVIERCPAVPIRIRDPSVPARLAEVIDHALAFDVRARIQTASDLRRGLECVS